MIENEKNKYQSQSDSNGMDLSQKIEGVLFYKAAPMKITALCKFFETDEADIRAALQTLSQRLQGGAIVLAQTDTEAVLVTAPELDTLIESVRKDEMKRDIGKAGAETLAIILYRGPIARAEIDRIRGVNSSFILRNLLIRGLIERTAEKNSSLFNCTPALLAHLGITNKTQLPEYASVLDQLEKFEAQQNENDAT